MNRYLPLLSVLLLPGFVLAQMKVNVYDVETAMIKEQLLGNGIHASNIVYTGSVPARASFAAKKSVIPFEHGVVLSTGYVKALPGPNNSSSFSGVMGKPGDLDLEKIANGNTFDAAAIEFDFIASSEMMSFRYVFGSEEYPEYVNSEFNDVFAFYLTDKITKEVWNLAVIPNSTLPITINTINQRTNAAFYVDNLPRGYNEQNSDLETIEMDGYTLPLVAFHPVKKGRPYHIKIVISDVGDGNLDSSVFLEGGSFISQPEEEFYAMNSNYFRSFDVPIERTIATKPSSTPVKKSDLEPKSKPLEEKVAVEESVETKVELKEQKEASLTVYFDTDLYQLNQTEKQKLTAFLDDNKLDNGTWFIVGHTDDVASVAYNQSLSEKRAKYVANLIKSNHSSGQKTSWKGEAEPVNKNSTNQERALNRRVEIFYKPN